MSRDQKLYYRPLENERVHERETYHQRERPLMSNNQPRFRNTTSDHTAENLATLIQKMMKNHSVKDEYFPLNNQRAALRELPINSAQKGSGSTTSCSNCMNCRQKLERIDQGVQTESNDFPRYDGTTNLMTKCESRKSSVAKLSCRSSDLKKSPGSISPSGSLDSYSGSWMSNAALSSQYEYSATYQSNRSTCGSIRRFFMQLLAAIILSVVFLFIAGALSDFNPSNERAVLQSSNEGSPNQTSSYSQDTQYKFEYVSSYIIGDGETVVDNTVEDSPTKNFKLIDRVPEGQDYESSL